jgi:hypothetical protein
VLSTPPPRPFPFGRATQCLLVSWLLAAAGGLTGCLGEPVEVSIKPAAVELNAGESVLFTVEVAGAEEPSVTWSVPAGDSAGTITAAGLYTAPAAPGTYEVKATSVEDSGSSDTATVTVLPATSVKVTVEPSPVPVQVNGQQTFIPVPIQVDGRQTFTATVTGATDTRVTWRVVEGAVGGTLNSSGTYTAPAEPGTFTVEAASVEDPRAKGTSVVTVTRNLEASATVAPVDPSVVSGQFFRFTGAVYGVRYTTALRWSVLEPQGGGITAAGLYLAPPRTGQFTIAVAPEDALARRALTRVEVGPPPGISVWIAPQSPALPPGGQQSFTASVAGTPNQAVSWSIREGSRGGTITAEGLYTAPALGSGVSSASYTVVATSAADSTRGAEVPVLVTRLPVYSLAINPSTLTLRPGGSMAFSALLSGVTSPPGVGYEPALVWRVLESGGGTVTTAGVYTAPATPGLYHVAAESEEIPDTFATVKVE